ncbi:MAG: flavodoxin family protein [Promethearchaeota archaeon]
MNVLINYYSRTGSTKKVANLIKENLNCDCEEIFDTKNRKGFFGYLKSAIDAMKKKLTILETTNKNPESYDLIAIGTPIWVGNMSIPIRTYIVENKEKFKKVAFFCTEAGRGGENCFEEMAKLCEKDPVATLEIKSKEIKKETHLEKIEIFTNELKK